LLEESAEGRFGRHSEALLRGEKRGNRKEKI